MKLLGFDGKWIWFLGRDIGAYDPSADRLISIDDLRRANPEMDSLWPVAFYDFANRLHVSTRDKRVSLAIDPNTLVAAPANEVPAQVRLFPPHPVDAFLLKAPARGDGSVDAAWVRGSANGARLTLPDHGTSLLTYWKKEDVLRRMLFVAQVDATGASKWETETGIGDLQQVLPDAESTAFIGTRPRVLDKVPEPILVVIDNETGVATERSLWLRD